MRLAMASLPSPMCGRLAIVDNDGDGATGDEVNDDGDGATGNDDDDDNDGDDATGDGIQRRWRRMTTTTRSMATA
mgnify:CR=1 FL=1